MTGPDSVTRHRSSARFTATTGWSLAALAGLLFVHAVVALTWLARDSEPLLWDMAEHAGKIVKVQHVLYRSSPPMRGALMPDGMRDSASEHPALARIIALPLAGPANWIEAFFLGSARPPLGYWLPAVALGPGDATPDALSAVHGIGWFLLLLVGTYLLGFEFYGAGGALLSAAIVSGYPIFLGQAREPMLDIVLAVCSVLGMRVLLSLDGFRSRFWSLMLGAVVGAGMLVKQPFVIVMALPIAWQLLILRRDWRAGEMGARVRLEHAVAAGLAMLLVAAPWYLVNAASTLRFVAMSAASGALEGDPASFSMAGLLYYPRSLVDISLGKGLTALAFAGALTLLLPRSGRARASLGLGIVGVVLVFAFVHPNKDARYLAPALPLLAVASAGLVSRLPGRALQGIAWLFVLGWVAIEIAGSLQPLPANAETSTWSARLVALGAGSPSAHPPRSEDWQLEPVLEAIEAHRSDEAGEMTLVVSESGQRYAHGLGVLAARDRLRVRDGLPVRSVAVVSRSDDQAWSRPHYRLRVRDPLAPGATPRPQPELLTTLTDLPGDRNATLEFLDGIEVEE